ncbi:uncharacterized protein BKA78DRAFT_300303 [Phyllosticta capitalensis]|uniref:uncharacterized protein n=1 Tax=Phyllosticta capitalensis TaxID=121624 RepID=UPI00312FA7C5
MTPTQDWVPWNCSQMDRKCQLTRSDYGAYPYLRALSELGKRSIRIVSVGFGESNKDDSQGSRHFDYALMSNWLRRQIEDSDEASALRDFPGCGQSSYDECFPKLPASTAAETEATPADLAPPSPLDVSFNEEWFDRFSQSRYRLLDDQHIFGELFQRLWESDANEDAAVSPLLKRKHSVAFDDFGSGGDCALSPFANSLCLPDTGVPSKVRVAERVQPCG